jgi:GAF domain-containing protein
MSDASRFPPEEIARLQEIADLGLTSPEEDPVLQDLVREAAEALDLPVALLSVVTDGVQYFRASHGLDGWIAETRGTPKEWSFCQHVVATQDELLVEDAARDPRVQDSPLVTQDGIACYLGVPLRSSSGRVLGSLCVVGGEPRRFGDADRRAVEAAAERAMRRVEERARRRRGADADVY